MAKIDTYLSKILSAIYGKDVRQAIHDSIVEINNESTTAKNTVGTFDNRVRILEGEVVELDITLTQSGKAADAKVTGDAINKKQNVGNYVKFVNGVMPDKNGNVEVAVSGGTGSGGNVDQNDSVFKGKIASFYGDSLTEVNSHYTKGYHAWVKDLLGLASYNNYGVSGYKVSNVYNKVDSVTDTADIIFVMCGVNDQNFSVPLGTMGDNTTDTTYGALNLLCALLKQKYPTSIVVFITPHYQTKYPHNNGITSYEVSKAIREVCEKYAIPVYDNFVLSGIYSTNLSTFTTDNCHWNDTAHEMVGKNLARFVINSFRFYVYGGGSEDSHTHSYTEHVITSPTCTTNGVKRFTCECGDSYTQSIPATGHNYVDGVCSVCGAPVDFVTPAIINNSVNNVIYNNNILTMTGENQTFYGVTFPGASRMEFTNISDLGKFGWMFVGEESNYKIVGLNDAKNGEVYNTNSTIDSFTERQTDLFDAITTCSSFVAEVIDGVTHISVNGTEFYSVNGTTLGYVRSAEKNATFTLVVE